MVIVYTGKIYVKYSCVHTFNFNTHTHLFTSFIDSSVTMFATMLLISIGMSSTMLVMLIAPNFFSKKEGPQVDSELAVTSLLATHISNF